MNSAGQKPSLSAPAEKKGVSVNLVIKQENPYTLHLKNDPDIVLALVAFILALGLTVMLAYFQTVYALYPAPVLLWSIYELIIRRPIRCVIDKQTGKIHYSRGGVLGSHFDSQDISRNIADIRQLEMQRHIRRWGDTFHISLLLDNHERLNLCHGDLDFGECQELTERIRDFLGPEVLVKAID